MPSSSNPQTATATITAALLLLLTLACGGSVVAQVSPACVPLDANSICGASYAGYSIYTSAFTSEDGLSAYVAYAESDEGYSANHAERTGCDPTAMASYAAKFRYFRSFYCSYVVYAGINNTACPIPTDGWPNGPIMCAPQCGIIVGLVRNLLGDPNLCPLTANATQMEERANYLGVYEGFCKASEGQLLDGNGGNCIDGAGDDVKYCGYRDNDAALNYCPSATDSCCKAFVAALAVPSTTSSTKKQSSTATALISATAQQSSSSLMPTSTQSPSAASDSSSSSGSGGNNIAIVGPVLAGSVALIIIAITITVLMIKKRKRAAASQHAPQYNFKPPQSSLPYTRDPATYSEDYPQQHMPQLAHQAVPPVQRPLYLPPQHQHLPTPPPQQQQQLQEQQQQPPPEAYVAESTVSTSSISPLTLTVMHPYNPTLADELELVPGQAIIILRAFDDGWGLGLLPHTGQQGAFPLVCVGGIDSGSETAPSEARSSVVYKEIKWLQSTDVGKGVGKRGSSMILE